MIARYRLKAGVQVDEVIEAGSNFGASPGDRYLTNSTGRHVHIKKEDFLALFEPESRSGKPTAQAAFVQLENADARIAINVHYDGQDYQILHVSGPVQTVKEYFDGEITLEQLREKFSRPRRVPR